MIESERLLLSKTNKKESKKKPRFRNVGVTDEMIIEKYNSKIRTAEIAEFAGITPRAVRNVLYKHGITRVKRPRKYNVNEDFFKTWSNEMAYVLGLISTDGFITRNPKKMNTKFSISQKEKYILEKVKKLLESEHPITLRTDGSGVYSLTISSIEMVEDLFKLGVNSEKTKKLKLPKMPKKYMSHYMRGVVDGDGWVQDRGYTMNVTTASESFANDIYKLFRDMGLRSRVRNEKTLLGRDIFRVFVSGKKDIINLADWLYKDSGDLLLNRKRKRFYINKPS